MKNSCKCPLCGAENSPGFHADSRRSYRRCPVCLLIYVPPEYLLSRDDEKSHYDLHRNDPRDHGYRQFLSRLMEPMVARLEPGARGCDFGSGPGPTLSIMFEEQGFDMVIYDPFYAPDSAVLNGVYDFITATEVVEHLSDPDDVLNRLWQMIKPGGWLGLMTKLATDREAFSRWHYQNDPTHIVFYSRETFSWLGKRWGVLPLIIGNDVILYQKSDAFEKNQADCCIF